MGGIFAALASGFLLGAAARWIVPGPDPMPFWLTVTVGLVGSVIGGGIAAAAFGTGHLMTTSGHIFATLLLEIATAAVLVVAYRRFVQRRPVAGPGAHRFPTRGFGVARLRARLGQLGIDPEQLSRPGAPRPAPRAEPTEAPAEPAELDGQLEQLSELHRQGVLSDEEYEAARERLANAKR